jgi:glycosyltransferase involved in cell wall biosynthesis
LIGVSLLVIAVPTFNRASDLARLLTRLDHELRGVDGVQVLVSDNASEDTTQEVLTSAAPARPWLRAHRQAENVGPIRNLEWLIENAPEADYMWLFGDDDLIVETGMANVLSHLRAERPAWLFLPHHWVDASGNLSGGSPAPGVLERYENSPELYRAYHHWLTFISASIIRQRPLQEAVRATETNNPFAPMLWFYRAGREGPCLVAANRLVRGSLASCWVDVAHTYLTTQLVGLYEEGLRDGLTEEEFGRSLDIFYRESLEDSLSFSYWQRVPVGTLIAAVTRFPHSSALRTYLWLIASQQSLPEVLPALDQAATSAGIDAQANVLLAAGEAKFEHGDARAAAEHFLLASQLMPTCATAWNDLAVAFHSLGDPRAPSAADSAVFVAPGDVAARLNRATIRYAAGDYTGAAADARHAAEHAPADAAAAELLAACQRRLN